MHNFDHERNFHKIGILHDVINVTTGKETNEHREGQRFVSNVGVGTASQMTICRPSIFKEGKIFPYFFLMWMAGLVSSWTLVYSAKMTTTI
jgi:hypothetical protein